MEFSFVEFFDEMVFEIEPQFPFQIIASEKTN
jgi:hypothetical protein